MKGHDMPLEEVKQEIGLVLAQVDERLRELAATLASGAPCDKVEAAGELEFLRQQKQDLERRLARLDRLPGGRWETLREWLREEASILERRVAGWIIRR
jgi:hypothetical protein